MIHPSIGPARVDAVEDVQQLDERCQAPPEVVELTVGTEIEADVSRKPDLVARAADDDVGRPPFEVSRKRKVAARTERPADAGGWGEAVDAEQVQCVPLIEVAPVRLSACGISLRRATIRLRCPSGEAGGAPAFHQHFDAA